VWYLAQKIWNIFAGRRYIFADRLIFHSYSFQNENTYLERINLSSYKRNFLCSRRIFQNIFLSQHPLLQKNFGNFFLGVGIKVLSSIVSKQGFRFSRYLGFDVSKLQGLRVLKFQGIKDSESWGFLIPSNQGFRVSRNKGSRFKSI
jgi:hypothetical protein